MKGNMSNSEKNFTLRKQYDTVDVCECVYVHAHVMHAMYCMRIREPKKE